MSRWNRYKDLNDKKKHTLSNDLWGDGPRYFGDGASLKFYHNMTFTDQIQLWDWAVEQGIYQHATEKEDNETHT